MIDRLREADCTIAYMGASVTEQRDGYRPRLHASLCERTGRNHRAVTAALGATGSITGVCMMDSLVIAHRPALTFVEYASSEVVETTPREELVPVLEGIVGKLRRIDCEPCFLYLHRSDLDVADIVYAYEDVARRHGVLEIDVRAAMRAAEGTLRDGVHTTPAGSQLVADAIADALVDPPAAERGRLDTAYLDARLEPPPAEPTGTYRLIRPYVELDAGGELRFTAPGELIGLLVILGPHSATIMVNGEECLLWDEYCTYERLGSIVLPSFIPAGSEVALVVGERPVGSEAPKLKLAGLMVRA